MTPRPFSLASIIALLLGAFAVACDRENETPPAPAETAAANPWAELEQRTSVDIAALNAAEPKDPAALRTRVYRLKGAAVPSLLEVDDAPSQQPADPFDPASKGNATPADVAFAAARPAPANPARQSFEVRGVAFPEGADAHFNEASGELIITHNAASFEHIEVILTNLHHLDTSVVNLRIEIFQLAAPLIPELSDSAARNTNHTPEWQAVCKLVDSGDASVVDAIGIAGRSGNRSKIVAAREHMFVSSFDWSESRKSLQPSFEIRDVGMTFEVDPVVSADEATINTNFFFEHHSAPPGVGSIETRIPESDRFLKVPTPVFHAHQITTQVNIDDGGVLLIGTWRPVGRPEFERDDLMHVAFLKADIQDAGGAERIR